MLRVSCDLGLASKQRRDASRRNENKQRRDASRRNENKQRRDASRRNENKQRREASRLYKNTVARHRKETSHYRKRIGAKRGTDTHLSFFES